MGKNRQGRATHITVIRREDQIGLGHSDPNLALHGQPQWWKDSVSDTLARLSSKSEKKKKKKSKSDTKPKKRHYTDEELFEATGGARFGMRAQRRATGKWARTEASLSEDVERDAKSRVEWNGHGPAKMLLPSEKKTGKKGDNSRIDPVAKDTAIVTQGTSSSLEAEGNDDKIAASQIELETKRKQRKHGKKASKKKKSKEVKKKKRCRDES